MNANELADELIGVASVAKPTDDGVTYGLAGYCIKAATMLRQQQAEIEALKNRNWELVSEPWGFDRNNEPNRKAEPVAWMVDGVLFTSLGAALNISFDIEQPCIPLYTHPAKTLTDEEIGELIGQYSHYENWEGFARAILRKASE